MDMGDVVYLIAHKWSPAYYGIAAAALLFALWLVRRRMARPGLRTGLSLWFGIGAAAAAVYAGIASDGYALHFGACIVGYFGYTASLVLVPLDILSVLSRLVAEARLPERADMGALTAFLALRIVLHLLTLAALIYPMSRCSV